MSWAIGGIIAFVTGLFYLWIESMITAPFENIAIQAANTTAQYGYWWFAPALSLVFLASGVMAFLALLNGR